MQQRAAVYLSSVCGERFMADSRHCWRMNAMQLTWPLPPHLCHSACVPILRSTCS